MASKKYILMLALFGLLQTAAFAQTTPSTDASDDYILDSSKVSTGSMAQYNQFKNNEYPYPAKPKNQWELGLSGGAGYLLSDIKSKIGAAGGLSLRKALGHVVSLRAGWTGSIINGEAKYGNGVNFKTQEHMLSLDALFSLNTISHYRGNPKTNFYVLAGYSVVLAQVRTLRADGQYHVYHDELQRGLITTLFGTNVPSRVNSKGSKSQWLFHGLDVGGGFAFKVSDKVNFGIEQKFIFTPTDELDALRKGKSNDILSYSTLRLNLNIGSSSKTIQPLWWVNPNNYVYNEVNVPKHMKIPTPVLPDGDGDGITDQFDQEPNTPAGAAVDSHGVAKDTDGDGVPDYKDKQLLTPQSWFPVDADGVGTEPESKCCAELRARLDSGGWGKNNCNIGGLPSVQFKSGSSKLSAAATASLNTAAAQINANPNCKVKVTGYGASSKREQQLSWDRVSAVIKYLVDKQGIAENRLIFYYGQEGDANTVDLEGTTEEGPNTVPAPHPNMRR